MKPFYEGVEKINYSQTAYLINLLDVPKQSRMFKKARPARPHDARTTRRTGAYVEGFEREERRWRPFSTSC